jgi:hypothetical protein
MRACLCGPRATDVQARPRTLAPLRRRRDEPSVPPEARVIPLTWAARTRTGRALEPIGVSSSSQESEVRRWLDSVSSSSRSCSEPVARVAVARPSATTRVRPASTTAMEVEATWSACETRRRPPGRGRRRAPFRRRCLRARRVGRAGALVNAHGDACGRTHRVRVASRSAAEYERDERRCSPPYAPSSLRLGRAPRWPRLPPARHRGLGASRGGTRAPSVVSSAARACAPATSARGPRSSTPGAT